MYVLIKLNENITIINLFYICSPSLKSQICRQMNLIVGFMIKAAIVMFLSHSALCAINMLVIAIIQIAAVLPI